VTQPADQQARSLQKAVTSHLNRHGYVFQDTVMRRAETLHADGQSKWALAPSEFPVEVNGVPAHVDLILRHEDHFDFLVCECKRVRPGHSVWCFFRRTSGSPHAVSDCISVEQLFFPGEGGARLAVSRGAQSRQTDRAYHHAISVLRKVDSDSKEPSGVPERKAIEEAATQVCRGLNGLVEHFSRVRAADESRVQVRLLPVIFTTAELVVSDADLGSGDLSSGNLDRHELGLRKVSWLYYQYHQSPGIKHSLSWAVALPGAYEPWTGEGTHTSVYDALKLTNDLESEYLRSIAVVSSDGIQEFLGLSSPF